MTGLQFVIFNPLSFSLTDAVVPAVMVNFRCRLDWIQRYPGSWKSTILGTSLRVFPEEINMESGWTRWGTPLSVFSVMGAQRG